jgi:Syntaxin-5 N-terminal, Sly1p-binding domain
VSLNSVLSLSARPLTSSTWKAELQHHSCFRHHTTRTLNPAPLHCPPTYPPPSRAFSSSSTLRGMVTMSIQDRTNEFRAILTQAQKRQNSSKVGSQRAFLLSEGQKREANGSAGSAGLERRARSDFAKNAAQVGRGITATMGKLERLAQCTSKAD